MLEERGQSISGTKAVLKRRLQNLEKDDKDVENDKEVENDKDVDDEEVEKNKGEKDGQSGGVKKKKASTHKQKKVKRKKGEGSDPVFPATTDFSERKMCKILKKMGLSMKGKKKELRARLLAAFEDETDSEEESSEEEEEEDDEEVEEEGEEEEKEEDEEE